MESAAEENLFLIDKLIDSNAVCLFNELIFITAQYRTHRDFKQSLTSIHVWKFFHSFS